MHQTHSHISLNQATYSPRERKIRNITLWGMLVNILLTFFKFIAGVFGKSAAMLADAVHSLSDMVSDIIVLIFVRISAKGHDAKHEYGHGKFETFATLILSLILLVVGASICASGVEKIVLIAHGGTLDSPHLIALIAAAVSILAKEILFQVTIRVGKAVDSSAVIANAWHHRSDAISSVGSLLGIGGAYFLGKQWIILDPIASCLISIAIIVVSVQLSIPAVRELLDASLPQETEDEILQLARAVPDVLDLHDLKTHKSGSSVIIDAHLVVDKDMTIVQAHNISKQVEKVWRERFGRQTQISLHIEPNDGSENEECHC